MRRCRWRPSMRSEAAAPAAEMGEAQEDGGWDTKGFRCTFSRTLAVKGIANWADVTMPNGEWMEWKKAAEVWGLNEGEEHVAYKRLLLELNAGGDEPAIRR